MSKATQRGKYVISFDAWIPTYVEGGIGIATLSILDRGIEVIEGKAMRCRNLALSKRRNLGFSMKFSFLLSTLTIGLLSNAAFAFDAEKYLTCFQALNRDYVGFQALYISSPVAVLLPTTRGGNKRGFYQITRDSQSLKWIANFDRSKDTRRSFDQIFRLEMEDGLPDVTAQTSYVISRGADLERPIVALWNYKDNPTHAEASKLETETVILREMKQIMNRRIAEMIGNLANSYFPNTSVLAKLLRDTLYVAKAIEKAPKGAKEIFIEYSAGNGGRSIPRDQAIQMRNAMKKRSLEMGEQYYTNTLNEIGLTGLKEMIGACGAIGSHTIVDAIELEEQELSGFLTKNIETVRALP